MDDPVDAASRHSLHALLALHAEFFGDVRTRDQLISAWHEACSHALYVHDQVAEAVGRWTRPANLRSWYAVTEDPLPYRSGIPTQPAQRAPRPARRRSKR
ncbi:hypothetical protein FB471_1302 [Amycolatopsis cihanbeyliensis]|uniref:Uncharacterized protein n=2 Tax=Amycolatopsis cihanbeyliensis TaxID=1128664 RepID=A0A542DEW2_AMYCI|nr:hypothetical protein FB471_1302 [Amycolatopsis cihanbeyliensis]